MGSPIDRILRDCPHGACCCPHALESCWRLACQVDLAAVDHHGETALHLAIRGGSVDWFEAGRILVCARCACFLSELYQLFVNCSVLALLVVVDFLSNGVASESAGTCLSLDSSLLCHCAGPSHKLYIRLTIGRPTHKFCCQITYHRLCVGHQGSALINRKNKMKETALHMACTMELSKVSRRSFISLTLRLYSCRRGAEVYALTGDDGNFCAAVSWS